MISNSQRAIEKDERFKLEEEREQEMAEGREAMEIERQKEEGAEEGPVDTKHD